MTYTQNVPTYEAIRWVETNLTDMQDFADSMVGVLTPPMQWAVIDETWGNPDMDGWLYMSSYENGYGSTIEIGGWLVYGPMWGTAKDAATFTTLTNAQFTAQFAEVV